MYRRTHNQIIRMMKLQTKESVKKKEHKQRTVEDRL